MTGRSVRKTLRESAKIRLGNTGVVISSGMRYFDPSVAGRISAATGRNSAGLLELKGFCQNFSTGETVYGVNIYAVDSTFFRFNGYSSGSPPPGEATINLNLARQLGIEKGDEITVRIPGLSNLPADAPFAPSNESLQSLVLITSTIADRSEGGDFSLGISQINPVNIFINISDLELITEEITGINRLLIANDPGITSDGIHKILSDVLIPKDIGLETRDVEATGGIELVSRRVFIDKLIAEEVMKEIPGSYPVLTYMANRISAIDGKYTPYSFIAALSPDLYAGVPEGDGIVINTWLADDLDASEGDTLSISWFKPDEAGRLETDSMKFIVSHVAGSEGVWGDSKLMPEFPGIAGSASCSQWDAGIAIDMNLIRDKDEEYWNEYRGTPKAFISYEQGLRIWGNNFGPATAIRFDPGISGSEVESALTGSLDPSLSGFMVSDVQREAVRAASSSVDFSSLFISLGIFIIISSLILFYLVISYYFDSKKDEIGIFDSLGFSTKRIRILLLSETLITALTGIIPGVFAGGLFNILMIGSLNSVWVGAVQTDTLTAWFDGLSLVTGFSVTLLTAVTVLLIKIRSFTKTRSEGKAGSRVIRSGKPGLWYVLLLLTVSLVMLFISIFKSEKDTILSFTAGTVLFVSLILLIRYSYLARKDSWKKNKAGIRLVSDSYYFHNVSHATAPVIFLATGIFAIVITGINRLDINQNTMKPGSGTGGFLLWSETAIPFRGDLREKRVKDDLDLAEEGLDDIEIVQLWKSEGDDASCLNLNFIAAPPVLGVDPDEFSSRGAFSAASVMRGVDSDDPWKVLKDDPNDNIIFGIADQTVLEWGLKIKTGDTLFIRSENGQPLGIVIASGLKSSVFQGNVIIGLDNFRKYFPSAGGSSIMLIDGDETKMDEILEVLDNRLSPYGFKGEPASKRLASFFEVTNTYLEVFTILGGFGVVLGIFGMGFILLRNFRARKKDFALMSAVGYSEKKIRRQIAAEQVRMIIYGTLTGLLSGLAATSSSITGSSGTSFITLLIVIPSVIITGILVTFISASAVKASSLISDLRKE
jgi:ABC-type antimicrobial peptide transport system permease subunit